MSQYPYNVGNSYSVPTMANNKPTGGPLALKMGARNPYLDPYTGRYRKPNRQEIIDEIFVSLGVSVGPGSYNPVVQLDDGPQVLRHCCTEKPYFFTLEQRVYPVQLPDQMLSVWYYFHKCGKLFIVKDTLS